MSFSTTRFSIEKEASHAIITSFVSPTCALVSQVCNSNKINKKFRDPVIFPVRLITLVFHNPWDQ